MRDAYVYTAHAEGALLLQQLQSFRLDAGESLTLFGIRLEELFTNLEGLEGEHAMTFPMTQKLTYLLSAIRREPHLEAAHMYLQAEMNRGTMTFDMAMRELHLRCQAMRADEALESAVPQPHGSGLRRGFVSSGPDHGTDDDAVNSSVMALVTTQNKRHRGSDRTGSSTPANRTGSSTPANAPNTNAAVGTVCLVAGCTDLCALPICRLHFASLVCGKDTALTLRNGYGNVTYDKVIRGAVYPATVPGALQRRVPSIRGGRKQPRN